MRHNIAIKGTRNYGEPDPCEVPYHGNNRTVPEHPILLDLDLSFTDAQEAKFIKLWNQGRPIWDIAYELGRGGKYGQAETECLRMHLELKGMVKPRRGGLLGEAG